MWPCRTGFLIHLAHLISVPDERTVITKERAAGTYRLSAYYLSKMTSEAPLMFLLPIIMTTISYWMTGLMPTAGNFVAFLMLVLLHSSVAQVSEVNLYTWRHCRSVNRDVQPNYANNFYYGYNSEGDYFFKNSLESEWFVCLASALVIAGTYGPETIFRETSNRHS